MWVCFSGTIVELGRGYDMILEVEGVFAGIS